MIHFGSSVYNSEFLSKKPNNSYQKKNVRNYLNIISYKKQLIMRNYIAFGFKKMNFGQYFSIIINIQQKRLTNKKSLCTKMHVIQLATVTSALEYSNICLKHFYIKDAIEQVLKKNKSVKLVHVTLSKSLIKLHLNIDQFERFWSLLTQLRNILFSFSISHLFQSLYYLF